MSRLWSWLRGRAPAGDSGATRWVVLDVETSGLDKASDALLAIGAIAVHGDRVALEDSFEVVVRQQTASARDNILVHGIGADAQLNGVEADQACTDFARFCGDATLVAFHAAFDRAFLARAMKGRAGVRFDNPWLDLAELAPALYPEVKARALDDWLVHFGIDVDQRHHAASDAMATAMLFVRLLAAVPAAEHTPRALARRAAQAKWLVRDKNGARV